MSSIKYELINKIKRKDATVCVIGLGYVGLPLIIRFVNVGFNVIGVDIDSKKVDDLNNGKSYISHISSDSIVNIINNGFEATTEFSSVIKADAIIICVPTPLNEHRDPDLSHVMSTVKSLSRFVRKGQLFSLESTTYPGTTQEEILPRLQTSGLKVGKEIFLVFSPEREDPGNKNFTTYNIPKIIGGDTQECIDVGQALYGVAVDKIVSVSSTRTAEMTKLLENIHRAVNIGLVNEMKIVADKMNIDIYEVIRAAATKPFGFTPYYPGPGLGGHCIPIDPFYLTWKAREYNIHTRFIELAGDVNNSMPLWVFNKCVEALNSIGKAAKCSLILVLGLSYKKNIDDIRESPSTKVIELLWKTGATINYSDPFVQSYSSGDYELCSIRLSPSSIKEYDLVILLTDHDDFDYEMIKKHARMIIDTRGVYKKKCSNVIKA